MSDGLKYEPRGWFWDGRVMNAGWYRWDRSTADWVPTRDEGARRGPRRRKRWDNRTKLNREQRT